LRRLRLAQSLGPQPCVGRFRLPLVPGPEQLHKLAYPQRGAEQESLRLAATDLRDQHDLTIEWSIEPDQPLSFGNGMNTS
jgi:hypothetical protein